MLHVDGNGPGALVGDLVWLFHALQLLSEAAWFLHDHLSFLHR